jgi:hypothetical protein
MFGPIESIDSGVGGKQYCFAAGQDLRPAMGYFSLRQFRHRSGRASGGRNSRQTSIAGERRDDIAVFAPTAATGGARVAQADGRAAIH